MAIDTTAVTGLADIVGEPLCIGDVIAYPVRHGSTMWMSLAVVRGVEYVETRWVREPTPVLVVDVIQFGGELYRSKLTRLDRIVKTPRKPNEAMLFAQR